MELTTSINIVPSAWHFDHQDRFLLMGSCFADRIGDLLHGDKFPSMVNPFGTLYNPASILLHLRQITTKEEPPTQPQWLVLQTTMGWRSWWHHSSFSAETAELLWRQMHHAWQQARMWLQSTTVLVVTFGSAWVYRLKSTSPDTQEEPVVANCHQQPDHLFHRKRLTVDNIVVPWSEWLEKLHVRQPNTKVIITVSPIRHKRDGLHENQLSKAILLLATEQLTQLPNCTYFPSYELMMDELRDYRFYADDMVHPSELATHLIYERFLSAYHAKEDHATLQRCRDILHRMAHHPFRPEGEDYRQFLLQTLEKIHTLQKEYPSIDWKKEIQLCNMQLKK